MNLKPKLFRRKRSEFVTIIGSKAERLSFINNSRLDIMNGTLNITIHTVSMLTYKKNGTLDVKKGMYDIKMGHLI
jgi:hypothetical protein